MANVIRNRQRRWPSGQVPYVIRSADFPAGTSRRYEVEWAIDHWNSRSRLKFVPRSRERDWVRFVSHKERCGSRVGRQGGRQNIRCNVAGGFAGGDVLHEIGHAVGLFHEHQRPDRDEYVTVTGGEKRNYGRKSPGEVILPTPYDYLSIMHYPPTAFLTAPDLAVLTVIGQDSGLSYLDLLAIEQVHGIGGGDYWLLPARHLLATG